MFFPRKVIVLFVHSRLFCSIIFRCTASYISGRDMHNLWKGYHHLFFCTFLDSKCSITLDMCVLRPSKRFSHNMTRFLHLRYLFLILVYDTCFSVQMTMLLPTRVHLTIYLWIIAVGKPRGHSFLSIVIYWVFLSFLSERPRKYEELFFEPSSSSDAFSSRLVSVASEQQSDSIRK